MIRFYLIYIYTAGKAAGVKNYFVVPCFYKSLYKIGDFFTKCMRDLYRRPKSGRILAEKWHFELIELLTDWYKIEI